MKFVHATIQVKDMEGSIVFYRDVLGLDVLVSFEAMPGTQITFLGDKDGGTKIELMSDSKGAYTGEGISLGFEVVDSEKQMQHIESLGMKHSPMMEPKPGTKFFFISDPNGVKIQFISQGK